MTFLQALEMMINNVQGLRHDMNHIKTMRTQSARDMDGIGRLALSIPDPAMKLLEQYHPELFQSDQRLAAAAWSRFIKHPDSKPFRTRSRA